VPFFELGDNMKLIDNDKSYLVGFRPAPAGVPFEVSDEEAKLLLEQNPSLREYSEGEPEPEPEPEPDSEQPEEDPQPAASDPEQEQEAAPQPTEERVAVYKGGGWYDLDGKSARLADIPKDIRIVRE
jgi:hypothetical protein